MLAHIPERPRALLLALHGLQGSREHILSLLPGYVERGFLLLAFDAPRHGKREGPPPSSKSPRYVEEVYQVALAFAEEGREVAQEARGRFGLPLFLAGGEPGSLCGAPASIPGFPGGRGPGLHRKRLPHEASPGSGGAGYPGPGPLRNPSCPEGGSLWRCAPAPPPRHQGPDRAPFPHGENRGGLEAPLPRRPLSLVCGGRSRAHHHPLDGPDGAGLFGDVA